MHGYSDPTELIGKNLSVFHTKEQLEQDVIPFNEKLKETGTCQGEVGHKRRDGTTFPTFMNNSIMNDEEGNPIALIGVARDITERKLAEEKLRESEVRFRGLFEKSPVGIEIYNIEGQLVDANQATLGIFGFSTIDEVRGFKLFDDRNLADEVKDRIHRGETVAYQTEFDFEKVKELDLYETSRDGVIHLDLMISPVILGGGGQTDKNVFSTFSMFLKMESM